MEAEIIKFSTTIDGIFVELPENVLFDDIWMNEIYPEFLQFYMTGDAFYDRILLKKSWEYTYEPLNFARDMTDIECRRIVNGFFRHDYSTNFDCWENYYKPIGLTYSSDLTPITSFNTLMKKYGIDNTKHWLVLLKKYKDEYKDE